MDAVEKHLFSETSSSACVNPGQNYVQVVNLTGHVSIFQSCLHSC